MEIEFLISVLKKNYDRNIAPSVTLISNLTKDPFSIFISTLISLRTKDQVTIEASNRLFNVVKSFYDIQKTGEEKISQLIYPAGFYKTKAKRLKEIAEIIIKKYNGELPSDMDDLLSLPGVGRKTANLVRILGFNLDGICVDTHVHRISNRLGLVNTKKPEETEFRLMESIEKKYWKSLNEYMVSYGQIVCKPISPHCTICELNVQCPKMDVGISR